MVPGLYLYETAFSYDKFGYASAIGVVMTIVLLIVASISNRSINIGKRGQVVMRRAKAPPHRPDPARVARQPWSGWSS